MTGAAQPRSVDRGRRRFVFRFDPIHGSRHQAARVQKMLRTEAALRPAAAIIEFDPQEIADFPENTVFYFAGQFSVGIGDVEGRAQRDRTVYLQTRARKGNVFQICNSAAAASIRVFPLNVNQIRAQHPGLNSAIQHNLLLLSDSQWRSISFPA
jgi:hypothetical protein